MKQAIDKITELKGLLEVVRIEKDNCVVEEMSKLYEEALQIPKSMIGYKIKIEEQAFEDSEEESGEESTIEEL